ncbi:ABC transporter permease [Anopheles sinensis]|uniref:ABC transporter permease n=1 Tax=Anopheles sinensis TaxID=74873 RepID=A0A084VH86_ANOSI|nr:ABC transporter permease [Anopheles sinensis]
MSPRKSLLVQEKRKHRVLLISCPKPIEANNRTFASTLHVFKSILPIDTPLSAPCGLRRTPTHQREHQSDRGTRTDPAEQHTGDGEEPRSSKLLHIANGSEATGRNRRTLGSMGRCELPDERVANPKWRASRPPGLRIASFVPERNTPIDRAACDVHAQTLPNAKRHTMKVPQTPIYQEGGRVDNTNNEGLRDPPSHTGAIRRPRGELTWDAHEAGSNKHSVLFRSRDV